MRPHPLSFRLPTIFYTFALLAAAMATFGPGGGILATVLVLWFWFIVVLPSDSADRALSKCLLAIFLVLFLCALAFVPVITSRPADDRCRTRLSFLARALHRYHEANGHLPPASFTDASGNPLLSWRASILPFKKLDWSQPWNDPANRHVTSEESPVFFCPSHHFQSSSTTFFAVVGAQTAWPGEQGRSFDEFLDGTQNTILLIEAHGRQVNWAEPRDLTLEEAVVLLTQPPAPNDGHAVSHGFFYKRSRGRHLVFADGRVEFLAAPLDRELAVALLTVDGREKIDLAALDRATEPQLDYAKCYGLGMFVVLSLLPAGWMFRGRRQAESDPTAVSC